MDIALLLHLQKNWKVLILHAQKKYSDPMKRAIISTQDGSLSLREACDSAISVSTCSHSVREWYYAHYMLMLARECVVGSIRRGPR